MSVDPSLQQLPYNEAGAGPWVGAEGNLGGTTWGRTLLLVVVMLGLLYVAGFVSVNYSRGLRGRHLLPHRAFWVEVWGLVQDGVQLSSARLRGEQRPRGRSRQIDTTMSSTSVSKLGGGTDKIKQKKEKTKRVKKEKGGQQQALSESLAGSTGPSSDPSPSAGTDVVARERRQPGNSSSAPSGDGGRWVHVPC